MKHFTCLLIALILLFSITSLKAQLPRTISYQGMLLGSNGQPVSDGNYKITFKLYDNTNTSVWTETHTDVFVGGGLFQAMLGLVTPLNLSFDKPYFLGIQVGSEPELQPRMLLASVAYAIRADDSNQLLGYSVSSTPQPNKLLPLDNSGKFPASVLSDGGVSGNFLKKNEPDTSQGTSSSSLLLIKNQGNGDGIEGVSCASNKSGVYGHNSAGYGVYGGSTNGVGVAGQSASGNGVTGQSSGSGKAGVFGQNDQSDGYGVNGKSTNGHGVRGLSSGLSRAGVIGENHEAWGIGVQGESKSYIGVYGYSSNSRGVHGSSSGGYGVLGYSASGTALYAQGTFAATGTKSAEVKLKDGTPIRLFSEEATEVYFNDYGEGTLINGRAHIELDPVFLQTVTVNDQHPMKVFVQLEDDCKGVFVANKTTTSFDVVELQGGKSNAKFSYRLVCKRKHFENERLATIEQDCLYNRQMQERVWPEVIEKYHAEQQKMKAMHGEN